MGVDILRLTRKKILAVAPCRVICHCARFIRERCRLSRLRYFSKAVSLQIDMKHNWQRASAESRDSSGMPRNKSPCIMTGLGTTAKSLRLCLQFRCFQLPFSISISFPFPAFPYTPDPSSMHVNRILESACQSKAL